MQVCVKFILLTPLLGIIFGALVANQYNIPLTDFSSNMIAVALGIPLALTLSAKLKLLHRHLTAMSLFAFGIMLASLLSFSTSGVHRWISIGSLHLNISIVFSPLFLYIINELLENKKLLTSAALTIGISMIHLLQPDAGQALAFGSAAIIIFILAHNLPLLIRLSSIIPTFLGIILVWRQPDPLPAVPQVEQILSLSIKTGSLGIVGVIVILLILFAPIFYILRKKNNK